MRNIIGVVAAVLVCAGPGLAGCRIAQVVDGDTLRLICAEAVHRVRLLGFDTPELHHPRCAFERRAAERATEVMRGLVAAGPITGLRIAGQDRYGRDLAQISVAGRDLGAAMLTRGLARPYAGGKRQGWCAAR